MCIRDRSSRITGPSITSSESTGMEFIVSCFDSDWATVVDGLSSSLSWVVTFSLLSAIVLSLELDAFISSFKVSILPESPGFLEVDDSCLPSLSDTILDFVVSLFEFKLFKSGLKHPVIKNKNIIIIKMASIFIFLLYIKKFSLLSLHYYF